MTEAGTSGCDKAARGSDAAHHSCVDPCCPGERSLPCLQVPVLLAFKGRRECGRGGEEGSQAWRQVLWSQGQQTFPGKGQRVWI